MRVALPEAFLRYPLAHRALHDVACGRPENSRAAVRAAIDAGYGIEIDVQMSADAQAMVFHDNALDRLADGSGPVRAVAADQLAKTPLKGGSEGIPDLPEVLSLVAGQVPLLIEIKDQDGALGPDIGPLEVAVAAALKGYEGPVAVMSFNPHAVMRMAQLCPDVPRGLVTDAYGAADWPLPEETRARLRAIPDYDRADCSFISHNWRDLSRPRVADLKAQGANILCWTVKSPQDEAEARKIAQNVTFEQYLAPLSA
ncbi:glycerophosphodiester phosphodiesterase family protein [Roseobacter sinensis]|uniref:Phosphodiesterase n=1 Tax=Roseobacter sinensis TaxID=2931391 RepID=A0ABT3BDH4_9RHOB|nr:glycerophosphodiester phosphodiesterase family protein [Roseobacter sp. WL0113]MCV3271620.1 phosphodiesterase [Roseobacter sp. WL0113]